MMPTIPATIERHFSRPKTKSTAAPIEKKTRPEGRLITASAYPGYHATRSIAEVIVGTLYEFVDGLIGGAVFAWLYNQFAGSRG